MWSWTLNLWQRIVFGVGGLILIGSSVFIEIERHLASDPAQTTGLLPFLWGILFVAVAVSPRRTPGASE